MAVKQELGMTWQCECGKWNACNANSCWKCHEPFIKPEGKRKRGQRKAETRA